MIETLRRKVIVNTRARHQADELDALITAYGAIPRAYPCIRIQPPQDSTVLDAALYELKDGAFDWLVLTSANTVISLAERLQALQITFENSSFKIAAIGTVTAQAAQTQLGLPVDLMPEEFIAESLASAILSQQGKRVLLPESAIARPTLAQALHDGGADVRVIVAYETVCANDDSPLRPELEAHQVDVVTFTSSSTVAYFFERLQAEAVDDIPRLLSDVCVTCIGPKTAQTASDYGMSIVVTPPTYTLEAMLDATASYFESIHEKR